MKIRRLLSSILSLIMIIGLLPTTAFAENNSDVTVSVSEADVLNTLGDEFGNSASIMDYGEDSYILQSDGTIALMDWSTNTQTTIEVSDAESFLITGDALVVAVDASKGTEIYLYSISLGQGYTVAKTDVEFELFSFCQDTVYYLLNGAIYSFNIFTNETQTVYNEEDIGFFYLYDSDIIAFLTDELYITELSENSEYDDEDPTYDPTQLLFLSTSAIVAKNDYEERTYGVTSVSGSACSYTTTVGDYSLPFSGLGNGSYFTTTGTTCSKHTKGTCACSSTGFQGVSLTGSQCFGFAQYVEKTLFGYASYTGNGLIAHSSKYYQAISNVSASSISTNYLKSILGDEVLPGANIRTNSGSNGYQHSLIYLGCDDTYVYTYEGNYGGNCEIGVLRRTWSELASYLTTTKYGICYIAMPYTYPGTTTTAQTSAPVLTQESYVGGKQITLSADSGATIYYTTDGTTPTTSSTKYTSAFNITTSGSTTIQAIATKSGYSNSTVTKKTISVTKLSTPTLTSTYTTNGMLITLTADSSATIYYTTNGTTPTTSSTKYAGGFAITSGATIKAIATASGSATSSTLSQAVSVQAPDTPSISLFDTDSKVAVGSAIQVVWDKQDIASSYKTSLYLDGELVDTQTTSETLASFLLTEVGEYTVTVCANNFVGSSADSYPPVTVQSMGSIAVVFEDWDGTILTEIEIAYGESPTFPSAPDRVGYNFNGWTVAQGTALYEDTTVTTYYTVQTYSVSFYDVDGTTLLQTVSRAEYGETLTPPENYKIDTGYVFAGWHIAPESAGTSFSPVDGALTVIATQAWENMDLPVVADITGAYRTVDGDSYEAEIEITNWDQSITKGRLITTLKTDEGKTLTTDISAVEFSLDETKNVTVTLNYTGRATTVEAMVVGVTEDGDTGGAYSKVASSDIDAETVWSEVDDSFTIFSGDPSFDEDVYMLVEITATQERNLQLTTASTSTLDGWTLYGVEGSEGSWSSWSTTKPSDQDGREIESEYVAKTYKTQYNYYGYKGTNGYYHFCAAAGKYVYGCTYSYIETGWRDSTLSSTSITSQSCSGSLSGCTHTGKLTVSTKYGSSPTYYFEETQSVQTGGGYYLYRYKDTDYTYYYYKYGDWSDWTYSYEDIGVYFNDSVTLVEVPTTSSVAESRLSSATAVALPSGVSEVDVNTVVGYSYRTAVALNDPTAGTEDTSGEVYSISGVLDTLDADFEGNAATILVYQKTNSDPTAEVLQYVGQTTIGSDNSYEFSFKAKSDPTEKTGDFIVSLALEGATRVINVAVLAAPKATYEVTFMADGEVLSTESVTAGDTVSVPEIPEKDGYTFVGWDTYTTNVDGNLTINAVFTREDCVVVKADFANDTVTLETQAYGNTLGTLDQPIATGKTFIGWYKIENGLKAYVDEDTIVSENTIIYADWETETYLVTFVDAEGDEVSAQEIAYGESAQLPSAVPTESGMIFAGWSTDVIWWYVTNDVTVYPIFQYEETAEAPSVTDDVVNVIVLGGFTNDTAIYYNIEAVNGASSVYSTQSTENEIVAPVGFDNLYAEGDTIEITEDVKITMVAVGYGINSSEVIEIEIPYIDPTEPEVSDGLFLSAPSINAEAGDTIEIPVYLSDYGSVDSLTLSLSYDTTVFTYVDPTIISWSELTSLRSVAEDSNDGILLKTLEFYVSKDATAGDYEVKFIPTATDVDGGTVLIDTGVSIVTVGAGDGYEVSGSVKSYNPTNATTITLSQDGTVKYTSTIEATTGSGQVEQAFTFASVSTGTYDLLVSKDGHTDYSITNLVVGSDAVDLTANSNGAISLITLLCGDINGDNAINQTDLNVLWLPANYNKTVETGGTDAALCDLNGDGSINQTDLNILWLPVNYNKSSITVSWET